MKPIRTKLTEAQKHQLEILQEQISEIAARKKLLKRLLDRALKLTIQDPLKADGFLRSQLKYHNLLDESLDKFKRN